MTGSTGSPGRWIPGSLGRWVTKCDRVPSLIASGDGAGAAAGVSAVGSTPALAVNVHVTSMHR